MSIEPEPESKRLSLKRNGLSGSVVEVSPRETPLLAP